MRPHATSTISARSTQTAQMVVGRTIPPAPAASCASSTRQWTPDSPLQAAFEYSDGTGNVLVKKVQAEPARHPAGRCAGSPAARPSSTTRASRSSSTSPISAAPAIGHRYTGRGSRARGGRDARASITTRSGRVDPHRSARRLLQPGRVLALAGAAHYDQNDTVSEDGNAWFAARTAPPRHAGRPDARRSLAARARRTRPPSPCSTAWAVRSIADRPQPDRAGRRAGRREVRHLHQARRRGQAAVGAGCARQPGDAVHHAAAARRPASLRRPAEPQSRRGLRPCYDIAGNLLFQHSMDAGDRWMLNDAAGKPLFAWDSRGFITRVEYDALHRPIGSFVTAAGDTTADRRRRATRQLPRSAAAVREAGLRRRAAGRQETQPARQAVPALRHGRRRSRSIDYDFKGNLLAASASWPSTTRRCPTGPRTPALEPEAFVTSTEYDALGRAVQRHDAGSAACIRPQLQRGEPAGNGGGRTSAGSWRTGSPSGRRSSTTSTTTPRGSASGSSTRNGATTTYDLRPADVPADSPEDHAPARPRRHRLRRSSQTRTTVQDLHYTYDPSGNITRIADDGAQDGLLRQPADRRGERLCVRRAVPADRGERARTQRARAADTTGTTRPTGSLMPPGDNGALRLLRGDLRLRRGRQHHADGAPRRRRCTDTPGAVTWNRRYQYADDSNRLLATSLPGDADGVVRRGSTRTTRTAT